MLGDNARGSPNPPVNSHEIGTLSSAVEPN